MLRFTVVTTIATIILIEFGVFTQSSNFSLVSNVKDAYVPEELPGSYRLPNNTRPVAYDVNLRTWIHDGNSTFIGTVLIDIDILEVTSYITLHQRLLTIGRIELHSEDGIEVNILSTEYDTVHEFLTIKIDDKLAAGARYSLSINYSGTLRLEENGFHRSSYLDDDGREIFLAISHFEFTDARHGFPCYDEPALKASFSISITHDSSYSAISNMPIGSQDNNSDGSVTTHFQDTPPISTYLVVFIVSDFEYLEDENDGNILHRTYARPNAIHLTKFALETGMQMMESLSDFVGVNLSFPKVDQVGAGPSANWGLITHRELSFFYDENTSTIETKTEIVTIIGHQFMHMWFGNLVTPSWWTYLWINEGFATFYGHYGVDLINTNWEHRDYFVLTASQRAMTTDARTSSQPMTNYVETPSAIYARFNDIVNRKSALVLRMFFRVCSRATFTKGVRYFLEARAYTDATEEHLFEALQKAVDEDSIVLPPNTNIAILLSSWTTQSGFPLISVTRNYDTTGNITFNQRRYLSEPSTTPEETIWWVPYMFALASDEDPDVANEPIYWLSQPEQVHSFPEITNNDWLIVNKHQYGFYRVLYDRRNYNLILNALKNNMTQIALLNRATLLDDAFNFAENNMLSYEVFFDIVQYLEQEAGFSPWYVAAQAFETLYRHIDGRGIQNVFRDFIRSLVEHLYDTVGIVDDVDEPRILKYSRPIAVNWACNMGSVHCRSDTIRALREIISSGGEFHQNLRDVMYCAALRNGNRQDYESVWNRMITATEADYRNLLITAMGCTSSSPLLLEFLNSSLSSTNNNNIEYRPGEQLRVFNSVSHSGNQGMRLALTFLTANLDEAFLTFGRNNLESSIIEMATYVTSLDLRLQFSYFLFDAVNLNYIGLNAVTTTLEIMNERELWQFTHSNTIEKWLQLWGQL